MDDELPDFKYHPDPIGTGSIEKSENECLCCGVKRGYIYTASVYSVLDLDDSICPWCIADGSAAKKFDASFTDDANLFNAGIPTAIILEVTSRTPGYISWQSEYWESHCEDACEFHGDASKDDIKELDSEAISRLSDNLGLDESDWKSFYKQYSTGGDPAIYKFKCRHCHKLIYNGDWS